MINTFSNYLTSLNHSYNGARIEFDSPCWFLERENVVPIVLRTGNYRVAYMLTFEFLHKMNFPKDLNYITNKMVLMAYNAIDEHWNEYTIHGMGD